MRPDKPFLIILAAGALTLSLAACSGSSDDATTSASAAESTSAATQSAETTAPSTTEPAVEESATSAAPAAEPAPEGALISAMTGRDFPAEVMGWSFSPSDTGPSDMYKKDGDLIGVEFIEGMDYDGAISRVAEPTTAGTGACGVTTGTSLVCYLRATDGLVVLSADTMDIPVEDFVVFANDLTSQLGTE